jgi:HlyD family secretion protein
MPKRHITGLLVAAFAILMMPHSALAQQNSEGEIIDEFTVEPDAIVVTVTATGVIEPERSVDLDFQLSAPVSEVTVQEGDSVQSGEVMARLSAEDLQAALREAEIALELQQLALEALIEPPREVEVTAAEAAVAAAEASVPAAGTGPTSQQIEIARVQADLARNALWQAQLNRDNKNAFDPQFRGGLPDIIDTERGVFNAETDVELADTNIEVLEQRGGGLGAIASAEQQLVQAQIALEDLLNGPDEIELLRFQIQLEEAELAVERARITLEQSELVAPFDGVVAQTNLTVGENPPTTEAAIQVVDNSTFYVELAIDENDVVDIEIGQSVSLRLDALPEAEITGTIQRIAITPDEATETVVYRARVEVAPTEANIRVGMSTTATITTRELQDVLVVPNRFIRIDRETQQAFVTVQRGEGRFEEIPVTLGERNNEVSEITSGVEPGQRIVLVPRESLGLGEVFGG